MKVFVPGQIAKASEVNANFDELKRRDDTLQSAIDGLIGIKFTTFSGQTTSNYVNVSVPFPPGTYTEVPWVFTQNVSSDAQNLCRVISVSRTQVNIQVLRPYGGQIGDYKFYVLIIGPGVK